MTSNLLPQKLKRNQINFNSMIRLTPESNDSAKVLSQDESLSFDNFSKSPQKLKSRRNYKKLQKGNFRPLCRFKKFPQDRRNLALLRTEIQQQIWIHLKTNPARVDAIVNVRNCNRSRMTILNFLRSQNSNSTSLLSYFATQGKSCLRMVCSTKTVPKFKASRSRFSFEQFNEN